MRCRRGRRSGTPVDFLPRERERGKKREQPSALSRVLFILERRKETPRATQSVPFLPIVLILLATRVIFLKMRDDVRVLTGRVPTIPK